VISALKNIEKGGTVVCGGIHMSDIPSFKYQDLWEERKIVSVANLTRKDGFEFFKKIENINIEVKVNEFELKDLNIAINLLRDGKVTGSQVVVF
jgi:propanol-preferring alcohol dehydrogenase